MKYITIKEIVDLVASDVPDIDSRIQRIFEWHYDTQLTIAKWILGLAASLAGGLLLAFFKESGEIEMSSYWMLSVPVIIFIFGWIRLKNLNTVHKQYVSALKLSNSFQKIKTFVKRYRQEL